MEGLLMVADPVNLDELKPIALKRKALAQGDKVRYRVYTSPTEFVAVIAENALMALKVSGVSNPHRILRDLPMTQMSVDSGSLVPHGKQSTAFIRPAPVTPEQAKGFEAIAKPLNPAGFKEVTLSALHDRRKQTPSTIDVQELLKALEGATVVMPEAEPMAKIIDTPASSPSEDVTLSPEEVEKLLNEPRA